MKFTVKIIVSVTAIIAIIFSMAGIMLCHQNFTYALKKTINQSIDHHLLERYGIENNMINSIAEDEKMAKEKTIEYAKNLISYLGNNQQFSIYVEKEQIYSNLALDLDQESLEMLLNSQEIQYIIKNHDKEKYIVIASSLEINNKRITFLSLDDVSDTFIERDRQLSNFYQIDLIVITISLLAIAILSICLTKPIQTLNEMSKKIAKGSYHERINIKTNDEIGELSESFNLMLEAIENKIDELEVSVKQREEFITNFTHELKNPMTSIIGYSDLLRSNEYAEEIRIKSANYIFNEAKRLELLAHKLMDLMGLSNENIKFETINMIEFAHEIQQQLKDSLGEIQLELMIEQATIIADKSLLEDCIRNLIDNSKKAEPKDQKIVFLGKKHKDKYEISIIDRGCGISKQDLPRIKDSFYRADKTRSKSNGRSGIGLTLSEKIAKLHHTELIIESEIGKGTKVTLYLPIEK